MFPWFHTLLGGNGLRRDGLCDRRSNRRRGSATGSIGVLSSTAGATPVTNGVAGVAPRSTRVRSQRRICLDGPDLTADQAHACFTGTNA